MTFRMLSSWRRTVALIIRGVLTTGVPVISLLTMPLYDTAVTVCSTSMRSPASMLGFFAAIGILALAMEHRVGESSSMRRTGVPLCPSLCQLAGRLDTAGAFFGEAVLCEQIRGFARTLAAHLPAAPTTGKHATS